MANWPLLLNSDDVEEEGLDNLDFWAFKGSSKIGVLFEIY